MIVFVTTPAHAYTHQEVIAGAAGYEVGVTTYARLAAQPELPAATYVFTDMDRLSGAALQSAATQFRRMRAAGLSTLNDPARFRSRSGLLRALHDRGVNAFNAFRIEENVQPRRWPVFLRVEDDHGPLVSGLLHSVDELERAVDRALDLGVPLRSLVAIEYAAEPVRPGLFRKLSVFRLGAHSVAHTCVHDDNWVVKYGKAGIASAELYEDELRIVRENPHRADVLRAFDIAGIEYGRADFGLVAGRAQVYEINSNPNVKFGADHPAPQRMESYRMFRENYLAALQSLDSEHAGTDPVGVAP